MYGRIEMTSADEQIVARTSVVRPYRNRVRTIAIV